MKSICKMFGFMVKQISQEMMMLMLLLAPVLAGIFFRAGIPLLEDYVLARYGLGELLVPYYELFSWLIAMLTGMLFAFVGGLVILGEIDDNLAKYLMVTPVGSAGYIASRIILPAICSGLMAIICVPAFSLVYIGIGKLLVMVISTLFSGVVTTLLVVAISTNKVEGMAVGKLSGIFGMTLFVPLLVKGWIKYFFAVFPMYWIGEWSLSGKVSYILIAIGEYILWIYWLYRRFENKMT